MEGVVIGVYSIGGMGRDGIYCSSGLERRFGGLDSSGL